MILPPEASPLLASFAPLFTQPTYQRFVTLMIAAILTPGRHTIANLLRTLGSLATGHRSSYQRVLSQAQWSTLQLGCALAAFLIRRWIPTGPITLVGDDTVAEHKGKKVYGKARHRDPVRSSHSYTAWRYGHKWIVLAVLVRFPFARRAWALPILVDLYRSREDNETRGRKHRTPAQLMCRLLRLLLMRFPDRQFIFVGDSSYGTHEVARFCCRHGSRLTLISKLHPEANLYEPPPRYSGKGRPRIKGKALPKPSEVAAGCKGRSRQRLTVGWYGGGNREVATVNGVGHWYKAGHGVVPIRWVYVEDLSGTHREEYFFTTDVSLASSELITTYTARWNIETTFQECRSCLELASTRGWCRATVLRAGPCLFGLYSVVAALYELLPAEKRQGGIDWQGKEWLTFSDAITSVRRWLWKDGVFPQAMDPSAVDKLPAEFQELILAGLANAA